MLEIIEHHVFFLEKTDGWIRRLRFFLGKNFLSLPGKKDRFFTRKTGHNGLFFTLVKFFCVIMGKDTFLHAKALLRGEIYCFFRHTQRRGCFSTHMRGEIRYSQIGVKILMCKWCSSI